MASIALEYGADEDEAIAALLHDAIEDQGGTETENIIREKFGQKVADIVRGCTDAETIPKPPWRERKEQYLSHLSSADASTLLVSLSDKLYNARAILSDYYEIGDDLWQRFNGGKDGTLWYYRTLAEAYRDSNSVVNKLLYNEYVRVVSELEECVKGNDNHAHTT